MACNGYNQFGFPVSTDLGSKKDFGGAVKIDGQGYSAMGGESLTDPTEAELKDIDKAKAAAEASQDEHAFHLGIGANPT